MAGQNKVDYANVGKRIRDRREALELTQGQPAKKIGVTASFIGHIERAEKVPSLETMARLCDALDASLDWLALGMKVRCVGRECPLYSDIEGILTCYGMTEKIRPGR